MTSLLMLTSTLRMASSSKREREREREGERERERLINSEWKYDCNLCSAVYVDNTSGSHYQSHGLETVG